MSGYIKELSLRPSRFFPELSQTPADEEGLICLGGDLTPEMVLDALTHGLFPWAVELGDLFYKIVQSNENQNDVESERNCSEGENGFVRDAFWDEYSSRSLPTMEKIKSFLGWFSPDPRAIFDLETVRPTKRLSRTMRSGKFEVTFNQAFPEVVLACATAGSRALEQSWITREFYNCYCQLFEMGYAISVECWLPDSENAKVDGKTNGKRLVGGVYGVALNGFFDGESMFSVVTDASKVALFSLIDRLKENNFQLFDLQVLNDHTESLGGIEIPRSDYLQRLKRALSCC